MTPIQQQYERLASITQRPCYSVTFWRTTKGQWGARAGLGENAFGDTLEIAIDQAVTAGIKAQYERNNGASSSVDGSKE